MTRRLVLTADDLGRETGSAAEIAALAAEGAITAATVIVVAPGADAAARAVADAGIAARLHATLSSERGLAGWHPILAAPSLVSVDGVLPFDPDDVGAGADAAEVADELDAQLRRLQGWGIRPLALDSHAGTLYGLTGRSFIGEALGLSARHGLGFRLPRDPTLYLGGPLPAGAAAVHAGGVEAADALGVRIPAAIATNRRSAAQLGGYDALLDDYLRILGALPDGTSEIFMHPAPEHAVVGTDGVVRTWELAVLRDDRFRSAIEAEGIELVAAW
ncbi:ChbG/HpnK family deacetylase [Agromyces laixinhei]|uniref:ChbG/HpnK family deacetylase n=1 Tax=Agromyces laixinhei TaxID=2585717 RepID=UPI0012ECBDF6|nr:ChbG/HpnK family deacetylase [Agromyces laixinhei]